MKPDRHQQQLPFDATYRERFALVDAVTRRFLALPKEDREGMTPRRWKNVAELLKAIHACSDQRTGESQIERSSLAARLGMSPATVDRARVDAQRLGLLHVGANYRGKSRVGSTWRVEWGRLAGAFLGPSDCHFELTDCHFELTDCQNDKAIKKNNSSTSSFVNSKVDYARRDESTRKKVGGDGKRPGARVRGSGPIDWDLAVGRARDAARRLAGGRPLSSRDWELVVKAACLVASYGEQWLAGAVTGVVTCRPRKRFAYLWALLERGATDRGRNLRRDLAQISLPAWVAIAGEEPRSEPRMCAAWDPDED